jgi:glc operon protein GlcG
MLALCSGGLLAQMPNPYGAPISLQGAIPVEGGQPLLADGRIIGAIGVSGDTSEHDNQCAVAGVAALK